MSRGHSDRCRAAVGLSVVGLSIMIASDLSADSASQRQAVQREPPVDSVKAVRQRTVRVVIYYGAWLKALREIRYGVSL